jgi:hypothetical protein
MTVRDARARRSHITCHSIGPGSPDPNQTVDLAGSPRRPGPIPAGRDRKSGDPGHEGKAGIPAAHWGRNQIETGPVRRTTGPDRRPVSPAMAVRSAPGTTPGRHDGPGGCPAADIASHQRSPQGSADGRPSPHPQQSTPPRRHGLDRRRQHPAGIPPRAPLQGIRPGRYRSNHAKGLFESPAAATPSSCRNQPGLGAA